MSRRRTSRPARLRRNFTGKQTLREVDHLLSQAEDDLEAGRVIAALSAYMMARDLACAATAEPDPSLTSEWGAVSREMAMVMDEIGEQLRQAGVR